MININFHFPTCKYLILFTWATLGYSQVAQWIFSKLLKLDGKFPDSLSPISILYYIYISVPYTILSVYKLYTSPWLNTCWCVLKGYFAVCYSGGFQFPRTLQVPRTKEENSLFIFYNTVMWLCNIKEILKCK